MKLHKETGFWVLFGMLAVNLWMTMNISTDIKTALDWLILLPRHIQ
jgi:hypothetical protein